MTFPPSRRSAILLSAAAALAVLPVAAVAQAAPSPFLGRWELDLSRMPATYGPPPKRVVYDFRAIGDGRWRTTIDITAPDDSVRHMDISYRPDGTMARGEGDTSEADSAAFLAPVPDVLVMTLARNRTQGSVRVYTVLAGGREMIESAAYVDGKGDPFVRTFRYRRLP